MRTKFTVQEMKERKGCYSMSKLMALPFMQQEVITIQDILLSDIPLKDKRWMIWNNCEITLEDKKYLVLQLAWMVLPIYEDKYPDDLRVRECLEAINLFNSGNITEEELKEKRRNAAAYAAAAAAAADAAYAYAAYDAADADAYAYDAAAYAAAAADSKISYKEKYLQILLDFFKSKEE